MYGHNDIASTLSLAVLRAQYQGNFFPNHPTGKLDPAIKDLNFAEMTYYGKIDGSGHPVYLNENKLVKLNQTPADVNTNQKSVLPFVKNMHTAMRDNITIKVAVGSLVSSDRSFVSLEPVHAYMSPLLMYQRYITDLFIFFNTEYLSESDKNNITSFESYVKYLYRYLSELGPGEPITFSGWTTSHYNSVFTTGLALSIKEFEYDADATNVDFAFNPMFGYFKKLAMNKGFCLVKQAPWIMLADLNSPAIMPMYQSVNGSDEVFDEFYFRTHTQDIQLIKNNIINYYNDFVLLNEYRRKVTVACNNRTFAENHKRQFLSDNPKYTFDRPYLKMYVNFRNIEERHPLPKGDVAGVIKNAKKKLDMFSATSYIADIFASEFFKKPFGTHDLRQREIQKTISNKGITLTKQQAESQAQTGGSMSGGGMSGGGSGGGY